MQHATCNMQHATCNVQRTACKLQGATPTRSMPHGRVHATYHMQHAARHRSVKLNSPGPSADADANHDECLSVGMPNDGGLPTSRCLPAKAAIQGAHAARGEPRCTPPAAAARAARRRSRASPGADVSPLPAAAPAMTSRSPGAGVAMRLPGADAAAAGRDPVLAGRAPAACCEAGRAHGARQTWQPVARMHVCTA